MPKNSGNPLPEFLNTAQAAKALGRKPQTLRGWACYGWGPIRPIHIGCRLAWPKSEIEKLLQATPITKEEPADLRSDALLVTIAKMLGIAKHIRICLLHGQTDAAMQSLKSLEICAVSTPFVPKERRKKQWR